MREVEEMTRKRIAPNPKPTQRPATRRAPARAAVKAPKPIPKVDIVYRPLSQLRPYTNNPRDNSEAIQAVRNAIREFGFLVPIVIDSNFEIAAGHTRYAAAQAEGMEEVPTIMADHLTEAQIRAFRVSDNKVAEIAKWNQEVLAIEMTEIMASGISMAELGFTQEEIDCLADMVADDCLSAGTAIADDNDGRAPATTATPRAPANTRMVIGEFVLFVPTATVYKPWAAMIRTENEFNAEAILENLKQRLGIDQFE
jgi:hypothetical protein